MVKNTPSIGQIVKVKIIQCSLPAEVWNFDIKPRNSTFSISVFYNYKQMTSTSSGGKNQLFFSSLLLIRYSKSNLAFAIFGPEKE